MSDALDARVAVKAPTLTTASGEEIPCEEDKPRIAYWRPGGKNMKESFWYDGVLAGSYRVRVVSSQVLHVAAIN